MNNIIQNIKQNSKLIIGVLIAGIFLGWLFFHQGGESIKNNEEIAGHEGHNHESADPTTWTCSMHPQIKMDKPGKCPICSMDLIPLVKAGASQEEAIPNAIVMTASAAKLADIETVKVVNGIPQKKVFLQGKIHADERNIAELTARFGGRIEKLFVNFTGQEVVKGQKLARLYSPGLVTAQRELLEAINLKESRPALYKAAKAKLKLWDLADNQIRAIEEKGEPQVYFNILSPITGTVTMRHVALGDYVKEGNALFQVVDLRKVWGMFDAYESDLAWIKMNDKIDFTVQAIPGKNFSAKVSYIDPFINPKTRIAKIRVEIVNKKGTLKPEMFLNGIVSSEGNTRANAILVPKSSILWTGKRAVVYVKIPNRENPTFQYREVVLGPESGAFYVIADGLKVGEEIATNGVFKIDAAAQLQGLPSMMNPEGGAGSTPHDMSKMNMGGASKPMSAKQNKGVKMTADVTKVDVKFKKQLTAVYKAYLNMKDAFITSDASKVQTAATVVKEKLAKVQMELLKGDAHMDWMEVLPLLMKTTNIIVKNADIKQQRNEFVAFNQAFYKAIKTFGLTKVTTYYQFCPMANQDKGAYWFSDSKEIRNPYLGDEMLGCGETKEMIN
ncbi:efflux RND transporter periplasmic adaptor subunit [Ancylomarina longa]|uniref:Efflux RND transporter periplasmic adaptor subunit n=1 Tax=Ancylomarina longa TaxID=2487017 RepID=A0A434AYX7_9BACT|nr:efflux RND transporter periplasmic adaptor subunit [Ancylomarina longa]RUT79607.1 efflux RND transporter periplasmic adaptor subunit [Ancylomarina longa]